MLHEFTGLKSGIASKVYFLLLQKPRTVSELSRILYSGKVQLSNIERAIDVLEKLGYIEKLDKTRREMRDAGEDIRKKYWKANYKPFLDYAETAVMGRKKGSPSPDREYLTKDERKVLQLILESKWFSRFYENAFLESQMGGIEQTPEGVYISSIPIQFLALMLEELCAIRAVMQMHLKKDTTTGDILSVNDFDKYIETYKVKLDADEKEKIENTAALAKKYLGNYSETNVAIDYYLSDYGFAFIPCKLAEKLTRVGRIPLTVLLNFQRAADYTTKRFKKSR